MDVVKRSLGALRETGNAHYAYLGVGSVPLYPQLVDRFDLPVAKGAWVQNVQPGTPADRAGIRGGRGDTRFQIQTYAQGGDIITKVEGKPIEDANDLSSAVAQFQPGQEVTVEVHPRRRDEGDQGQARRAAAAGVGQRRLMSDRAPLVLVSNRGPVTYQDDGSVKRGTGGLVTALTGLASHRDAIWIASAMTERDVEVTEEHGGRPFEVEAPEGGTFRVRFVASDAEAYDRFYNIIANPMLWFIQHYLWDQSNAPDIRRHEVEAFEHGYKAVNEDLAECVLEQISEQGRRS